jgi:hypothetical protein
MIKIAGLLALLLLSLSPAAAQDLPQLSPETMVLIEESRALPPEFSADTLLRLAGSRLIADPGWKRQLIEEAFAAGGSAQLPYRRAAQGGSTDTRYYRAYMNNGLEALTLQTRAVESLLELDPQRARAIFEQIPTPQVPAMTCQETGTPVLSAYYQTAARLVERAFTADQRAKGEHVQLIKQVVGRMHSPAHVTPAVKLIFTGAFTDEERQELVSTFANTLPLITGSPRVFGDAMFQLVPVTAPYRLPPGIKPAAPLLETPPGQLPQQVVAAAPLLLPALRSYIVRHVSAPRCSEQVRLLRPEQAGQLPSAVNDFNYLVTTLDPNASMYKPISQDEAKPARDAGTYESTEWWQSDRGKQVLNALKWLNHGNRTGESRFFTLEERETQEWNTHFVDTLRLIEGWKEIEESSPEDWFGMVTEAYELMAELAPPGVQREAVMTRYMNLMETHYSRLTNHNLWFTQLKGQWRSKDPWIVEQFTRSTNPVMSFYARLNQRLAE